MTMKNTATTANARFLISFSNDRGDRREQRSEIKRAEDCSSALRVDCFGLSVTAAAAAVGASSATTAVAAASVRSAAVVAAAGV